VKNYRQIYRPYEIRLLTVKIAERRNAYLSGHPLKEVELPLARGLPVKTVFAYYQERRRIPTNRRPGQLHQLRLRNGGQPAWLIDANALSKTTDPGHQKFNNDNCTESRQYDELNRLEKNYLYYLLSRYLLYFRDD